MRVRPPKPRTRPPFIPQWEGPFENYARSFVRANFWRVQHLLGSEEDAVQECALVFTRCVNRYMHTVTEPKHLMALFKTACMREFHSFSVADIKHRADPLDAEHMGTVQEDEPYTLLTGASAELCALVEALVNAPSEIVAWVFGPDGLGNPNRAAVARRARRMLRINVGRQSVIALADMLKKEPT